MYYIADVFDKANHFNQQLNKKNIGHFKSVYESIKKRVKIFLHLHHVQKMLI